MKVETWVEEIKIPKKVDPVPVVMPARTTEEAEIIQKSISSLNSITKADITELKSLANPPRHVKSVI